MSVTDLEEDAVHVPPGLVECLNSAASVSVLTGAGVSAESGIPTFRQAQTGLWAKYQFENLATPEAFAANPSLVWEWYHWRRDLVLKASPNPGHYALVSLEAILIKLERDFCLITQNVDGLHQRAGSQKIIELHGNIMRTKCSQEGIQVDSWEENGEIPPRCPVCGGYLRPDVVWFGEALPEVAVRKAWNCASTCDLFFSIGTSTIVEPAASLPFLAARMGATMVEINPEETPLTAQADYSLRDPSGAILPALLTRAYGYR